MRCDAYRCTPPGESPHSGAIAQVFGGIAVAQSPVMKRLIVSSFIVALGSLGLDAQATPDFSGTWTMDLTRSEAAAQGTPIGPVTVAIRQTPDEVNVETTRNGMTEAVRYLPAAMKPAAAGGQVGTFRWDGARLVTYLVTHINNQAVTVEESRSLNGAGTRNGRRHQSRRPTRVSNRGHRRRPVVQRPEHLDGQKRLCESTLSRRSVPSSLQESFPGFQNCAPETVSDDETRRFTRGTTIAGAPD